DALVALQSYQPRSEDRGDHLRGLSLADARRAFEQQRFAEADGEADGRRQPVVDEIGSLLEPRGQRLGGAGKGVDGAPATARCAFSAPRLRGGSIGRVSPRTPTASKMAWATAGICGLAHISPGPFAP